MVRRLYAYPQIRFDLSGRFRESSDALPLGGAFDPKGHKPVVRAGLILGGGPRKSPRSALRTRRYGGLEDRRATGPQMGRHRPRCRNPARQIHQITGQDRPYLHRPRTVRGDSYGSRGGPSSPSSLTRRPRTRSASGSATCGRTTASSSAPWAVSLWTSRTSARPPLSRFSKRRGCRTYGSTTCATPAPRCYSPAATIPSWCKSCWATRRWRWTLDRYSHVLPGMGDQTAAAMEVALS